MKHIANMPRTHVVKIENESSPARTFFKKWKERLLLPTYYISYGYHIDTRRAEFRMNIDLQWPLGALCHLCQWINCKHATAIACAFESYHGQTDFSKEERQRPSAAWTCFQNLRNGLQWDDLSLGPTSQILNERKSSIDVKLVHPLAGVLPRKRVRNERSELKRTERRAVIKKSENSSKTRNEARCRRGRGHCEIKTLKRNFSFWWTVEI